MRLFRAALAAALCLSAGAAFGSDDAGPAGTLKLSGEAAVDAVAGVADPFNRSDYLSGAAAYAGMTSITLNAVGGYRDSAKAEASILARLSYPSSKPALSTDVRKLYVSVFTERADLSAGRMIVNYGRGTVFSPVDLFSRLDLSEMTWTRIGTDCVRVQVPFGDLSGLDLVSTLAESPANATAGGRLYGNIGDWDLALSAFRDGGAAGSGQPAAFFGADVKGDAVVGLSGEAVARVESGGARCRFMAGADYSIGGEWLFDVEYLANVDAGAVTARDWFPAAHNGFASVTWLPDKLTTLDIRSVVGFSSADAVYLVSFAVSRSVARGATLSAYARWRSGDVEGSGLALASIPSLLAGVRLAVAF